MVPGNYWTESFWNYMKSSSPPMEEKNLYLSFLQKSLMIKAEKNKTSQRKLFYKRP